MMLDALSSLTRTPGVTGCAVFDAAGECVVNTMPPPYEAILLSEALRELASGFDFFLSLGGEQDMSIFVASCSEGRLVVRRVGDLRVLVVATRDVNVSTLHVAMNVAALHVERAVRAESPPSVPPGSSLEGSGGARPGPPADGSSGSSWREGGPAEPPDAAGRETVRELLRLYQKTMGPAAKLLLKQALGRLGVTARTLRRSQFSDLVQMTAARITDPEAREAYARAAAELARW